MRRTAWCAALWVAGLTAAFVSPLGAEPPAAPLPVLPVPVPPRAADDETSAKRKELMKKLDDLAERLGKVSPTTQPKTPTPRPPSEPVENPLDRMRRATNLFRDGDVAGAGLAFTQLAATSSGEERAFAEYMSACCLRRLNRRGDAMAKYREVADAKEDPFYADCAQWQLSLLRSTEELEAQLEQLRARAKTR